MTIYSSGKEPRIEKAWSWIVVVPGGGAHQFRNMLHDGTGNELSQPAFNVDDILATDWEVKP